MVERCSPNPNANVRGRSKIGNRKIITNLELLEAAVRRDRKCSHEVECIFAAVSFLVGRAVYPIMTSIKVPPLGESIVEATISRWLKNEGDPVAPGDTLVELETDKITVEVPSVTGGVLKKRFAKEGDVVKLDQLLAEVDEKADGAKQEERPTRTTAAKA